MRFTVDGREIEAESGQSILEALDGAGVLMNGVDVPHYCWHPNLSIDGSCRLCQVEVEGQPKLQIACNTPVSEGMVVHTKSERVRSAREGVMELLLINHPLDCPICDQAGECKLQDYAFEYGVEASRTREPRRALRKRVDLGPTIVFDEERCILCRRCVRFCDEVPQTGELSVFGRGDRSVIGTFPGQELDNAYSMNVADVCPVGALTTKDFRFKMRVWFLEDVPSVCSGCSKGCNLEMGVAKGEIQRYVPRRNDDVNDSWMCDEGRLSYREVASPARLNRALVRGDDDVLETRSIGEAISEAALRLQRLSEAKGAGVIAGIVSARATNEDLFTIKRVLDSFGAENVYVAVETGEADGLLIQAEKGPNAEGARALGFAEARQAVERIRGGALDGLVVFGHELLSESLLGGTDALSRIETIVLVDSHRSELERVAHVVIPARHAAEKRGTFTNHARRVQAIAPGVEPAWEAYDEGAIAVQLAQALGLAGFEASYDVGEVSRQISREVVAFAGIEVETVGEGGRVLHDLQGRGAAG